MSYRLPNSFSNRQQIEQLLSQTEQLKPTVLAAPQKWPASLQEFAQTNAIANLTTVSKSKLIGYLKELLSSSPQVSLVVASMPTSEELAELTGWLRLHIHPQVLLHVAQNSDLIAGCILRTDTSVYDLSLRSSLYNNTDKLVERLQHV